MPIVEAGPLKERAIAARGGLIGLMARPMRSIHFARSVLVFEQTGYFFPSAVVTTNWKDPGGWHVHYLGGAMLRD